ncbi:hypothetical protein ACWCPJ_38940, partial [Streptomyces collinus]
MGEGFGRLSEALLRGGLKLGGLGLHGPPGAGVLKRRAQVRIRDGIGFKTVSYVVIARWAVHGAGYVELDCSGRVVGDRG